MKELKKSFSECKAGEIEARKNNTSSSKHYITNHVESVILKKHNISKSCCHGGDLQGNDIRRLMTFGVVVFQEIGMCIRVHKPGNVTINEIEDTCTNFAKLCNLMDSMFSVMCSKKGAVTPTIIESLKSDLNL